MPKQDAIYFYKRLQMYWKIIRERMPGHMVSYCGSNNFSQNCDNHKYKKLKQTLPVTSRLKLKCLTNFPFSAMNNFDNCVAHRSLIYGLMPFTRKLQFYFSLSETDLFIEAVHSAVLRCTFLSFCIYLSNVN